MNQLEITQIKTEREKSENQQIKYTHTENPDRKTLLLALCIL